MDPLQDCEDAIQLDPRGCPLAYFRRVRALQALKQLQVRACFVRCLERRCMLAQGCVATRFSMRCSTYSLVQCARLALEQYKALFPERCSTEDVAAISAALERQLRQRQRQWEQWQMQRKHEKRILEVRCHDVIRGTTAFSCNLCWLTCGLGAGAFAGHDEVDE